MIICANEAPQSSDYTSGLGRRRQTIYLTNKIPFEKQRNLISFNRQGITGEFASYLPGLLNWVLAMPDAKIEQVLRETPTTHERFQQYKAEVLCQTNPIADWLDQAIVYRPGEKTNIGVAKRDKDSFSTHWFQGVNQWLYANYAEFCQNTGTKILSLRRFVPLLYDLTINQLGLMVSKKRDRYGAFFEGLKLRSHQDDDPLLISGKNPPDTPPPDGNGGVPNLPSSPNNPTSPISNLQSPISSVMDCDGNVTAETLTGDGCDGCDGLFQNPNESVLIKNGPIEITQNLESSNLTVLPSQEEPQTQTVTGCDGNQAVPSQPSPIVTELLEILTELETTNTPGFHSAIELMAYLFEFESKINAHVQELETACPGFSDLKFKEISH